MASLLPAYALLLFIPVLLTDTVSTVQTTASTEVTEAELPTISDPNGNISEEVFGDQPCRTGTNCGIHVFRVALSSRPEEVGDVVAVKQRKKYGNNVYVPRGSQDSFVLRDLAENIPPDIDSRVKDRIRDHDFVIKPVDSTGIPTAGGHVVWIKDGEPLPKNFEPMRQYPASSAAVTVTSTASPKEGISFTETILFIVTGILAGVILTGSCVLCVMYNRRPRIDRSAVVSHRRGISHETLPLPLSVSSNRSYPHHQLPSVRSTTSSQSTFDGSIELTAFDDSSFHTRSSIRNHRHTPRHTSTEHFEPLRKISI